MAQTLPEVRETDASPQIAAIYADIKASAALPQVNLIFRYFATKPGVLEWIWETLRPLYRSNELAEAARALAQSVERTSPSPLSTVLTGNDLAACQAVLDSYNSGNPQNLIALTALVRVLGGHQDPASPPTALTERTIAPGHAAMPFPALPKRNDLDRETVRLIEKMAARHASAPGVVPSMYLHLALWPAALTAVDAYLQPIIGQPDWETSIRRITEQAGKSAEPLDPNIHLAANPPAAEVLSEVTGTVSAFIETTIPDLIAVGRLLAID
jgi:Halocarboxylic acid dehydrogenase DehI